MLPQTSQAGASAWSSELCWLRGSAATARRRLDPDRRGGVVALGFHFLVAVVEGLGGVGFDAGAVAVAAFAGCGGFGGGRGRAFGFYFWFRLGGGTRFALGGVGGAVAGDEFHRQPAEDVIDQALGDGDFGVAGHAAGLEADVLEFSDQGFDGHAVLQADGDQRGDGVHQAADGGAFLGHADEDFAGLAVVVEADGDVAFVAGDVELVGDGVAGVGQAAAQGRSTMRSTIFSIDVGVGGREIVAGGYAWRRRAALAAVTTSLGDFLPGGFDVFFVVLLGARRSLRRS